MALRRGALGDTLLFFPVLEAFRRSAPGEELLFVGHGDYLELALAAGLAQRVHPASTWPPLLEIFQGRMPPGPPPEALARASRVLLEWEEDGTWGERILLFSTRPREDRRESLARTLLARSGLEEFLPWPPPPLKRLRESLGGGREERGSLVVLHAGAGSIRKAWPAGAFARLGGLLERKGLQVEVLLGPAEEERGPTPAFFEERGLAARVVRDAVELGRRLVRARAYVGNDSGPSHLAAALGVPALVLFGPTDPKVWGPPWPGAVTLQRGRDLSALDPEFVLEVLEGEGLLT